MFPKFSFSAAAMLLATGSESSLKSGIASCAHIDRVSFFGGFGLVNSVASLSQRRAMSNAVSSSASRAEFACFSVFLESSSA